MDPIAAIALAGLILLMAMLYSSVGHAGASGYLAAMALFGLAPHEMKPAALALNVLVATIATVQFHRAGCFSARLFIPLVLASAPLAFLGGMWVLPDHLYKPVIGMLLIYAAAWSFIGARQARTSVIREAPVSMLIPAGAAIGLLSGLTGVGGGIFLSPLLLMLGWAQTRVVSGVAAPFILVNSVAALLGMTASSAAIPAEIPLWIFAAVIGGSIGAYSGARRFGSSVLLRLLSVVLLIAGVKMIAVA